MDVRTFDIDIAYRGDAALSAALAPLQSDMIYYLPLNTAASPVGSGTRISCRAGSPTFLGLSFLSLRRRDHP